MIRSTVRMHSAGTCMAGLAVLRTVHAAITMAICLAGSVPRASNPCPPPPSRAPPGSLCSTRRIWGLQLRLRGAGASNSDSEEYIELLPSPMVTGELGKRARVPVDKWVDLSQADGLAGGQDYEEADDDDWSPDISDTLTGTSDLLSELASGATETSNVAQRDSARDACLRKAPMLANSVTAVLHPNEDHRAPSPGAPVAHDEKPAGAHEAQDEDSGCVEVREVRMERFTLLALLRRFVHGRAWLEPVLSDPATRLSSLKALHRHLVLDEKRRLLGAPHDDSSPDVRGFVASGRYLGERDGMLFRQGQAGLGYYPLLAARLDQGALEARADDDAGRSGKLLHAGGDGGPCNPSQGSTASAQGKSLAASTGGVNGMIEACDKQASGRPHVHLNGGMVMEMVDEKEAAAWELDARFVGEDEARRWRLSHSIAGDTADNVTATSLSGAALEEVDDELAEEQGSAAFDEGPDEACQSSERDEYGNRLNATHWHNSLMAATGMDLMAAARAAARRHFLDAGRQQPAANQVDDLQWEATRDHDAEWASQRGKDLPARDCTQHGIRVGNGKDHWGKEHELFDVANKSPFDGACAGKHDLVAAAKLAGDALPSHVRPETVLLVPPKDGWNEETALTVDLDLFDDEGQSASEGGREWMTPEEIAQFNQQTALRDWDPLPTYPVVLNASDIVMQSKRETCPCRDHPFPCISCQGVPRVFFRDSEADDSWPEITRHEFHSHFPFATPPQWPAAEGQFVPDEELIWWAENIS